MKKRRKSRASGAESRRRQEGGRGAFYICRRVLRAARPLWHGGPCAALSRARRGKKELRFCAP
ncbi:MAG: hypothetical protein DBX55_05400 [Verrucomicrobia bacterium]|nr:MAG: hypothetical protein DBX55_05400 [Verrucomicrobiota bacterium]